MRGVLANPPELQFDSIAPRRRDFARLYAAGAEAAGFDATVDPHLPFDMMLGTALGHMLANGRPMTLIEAEQLAEIVIRGLRTG